MDPITLILFFLFAGGAAAATVVTVLKWATVDAWLGANKVTDGSAEIVRERLANGHYRVVAGVFTASGSRVRKMAWETTSLDPDLARRLGTKDVIRVTT